MNIIDSNLIIYYKKKIINLHKCKEKTKKSKVKTMHMINLHDKKKT